MVRWLITSEYQLLYVFGFSFCDVIEGVIKLLYTDRLRPFYGYCATRHRIFEVSTRGQVCADTCSSKHDRCLKMGLEV